jgi:hypothetical protein
MNNNSAMIEALRSNGPHPELAAKLQLFGQFVGSWEVEIINYRPDGSVKSCRENGISDGCLRVERFRTFGSRQNVRFERSPKVRAGSTAQRLDFTIQKSTPGDQLGLARQGLRPTIHRAPDGRRDCPRRQL